MICDGCQSEQVVESGTDGRFSVDLPAGNTRVWLSDPPAGYLVLSAQEATEDLTVRPDQPEIHRDYRLRKGARSWKFQFTRVRQSNAITGFVSTVPLVRVPVVPSRSGR